MRRNAVLGLTLIGLLLASATHADQDRIPIPNRTSSLSSIDPYWDGSVPITITKSAANTTWVRVHDDSSCSFTGSALFGGRGETAPGWATWCFDGGLGDTCSTTGAYGGTLPGCWTHYDAHTFGSENRWHVSTYDVYQPGSANSDSSMWCGELGNPDTWLYPPGYGHNYNYSMVVNLGTTAQFSTANGMTIGGVHLYSIELAYDYCFVQMAASGTVDTASWLEVARFNTISNPDSTTCRGLGQSYWGSTGSGGVGTGTSPYLCADWTGFNINVTPTQLANLGQGPGENLFVRWYCTSDLAWDDVDGSGGPEADTRGAWRVDNISIKGAASPNSYYPSDPTRTDKVDFEQQVPSCPVPNPLCEPGRDKITFPLLPKADDGSGYWNGTSYIKGKPLIVDLWHLTNTPTYANQAKTCESSNRWMWASNLTPAGADGNITFDGWYMRLASPVFYIGPGNPYTGTRVTGNVVFRDEYLCIKQISNDGTDTQVRVYDNGNWLDWDGDGFSIIGGCEFWNIGDVDNWTDKVSATSDSIQYGFEFFDQCDYNAAVPLACMGTIDPAVHRKNTYIVDNISIGFFDQTSTLWTADPQDLFQDTFARNVYVHPTTKENSELFPGDVREQEDSLTVTVSDIDGIMANSVTLHYRVSTTCGTSWTHENTRPQGSKAAPAAAWFQKAVTFSFPLFPANPPPGREFDGEYRTTLELNATDFPGTLLDGSTQLREGTVIEYYFTARDNGGVRDTLPDRRSNRRTFIHPMYGTERQQEWPFEVTVLPCETNYAGQGNHRLLVNNDWYLRTSYDAESDKSLAGAGVAVFPFTSQVYEEALRDLNVKYDRYDNNASQISRGTATPFYSEPTDADGMGGIRNPATATHRYNSVLWATGRHNHYTVTDSSQLELSNYLLSGANEGNIWISGQNVCEDEEMSGTAEAFNGGNFWRNFIGANLVAGGCDDNSGISPRRFYIRGAGDAKYTPFQTYAGWADCPLREQPDAAFVMNVGGTGTETVIFNFDNNTSDPGIAVAGIRDVQSSGNMAITTMWDLGLVTTRAARACITRAVLLDFGMTMPLGAKYDANDCDATGNPVDVTPGNGVVRKFGLDQNYPNPFNPSTRIRYSLPKDNMKVELTIFDVSGRQVKTLVNRLQSGAEHEIFWDGRNDRGEDVSSGVYFYSLKADAQSATKKMVL
ncbi:MAG: FlgD immunoglobulin-like domain containing protein, partial [bacterium]